MEDTTVQLFKKYVRRSPNGQLDASQVLDTNCYMEWLAMKKLLPKKPAEAFRKAITGHVRGDNGLHPFTQELEAAVLKVLRQKRVWPCFINTSIKIGLRGFQTEGYWEKQTRLNKAKRKLQPIMQITDITQWCEHNQPQLKKTRRQHSFQELLRDTCEHEFSVEDEDLIDLIDLDMFGFNFDYSTLNNQPQSLARQDPTTLNFLSSSTLNLLKL